jgi:D-sedoheptulose 7-phosphate isomerase
MMAYNFLKPLTPSEFLDGYCVALGDVLDDIDGLIFNEAYELVNNAYICARPIYLFGNGGSTAIVNHAVVDLVKGVGHDAGGIAPRAQSLCSNAPLLTCLGNDFGFENIFSKQIEMMPFDGPLFIGVSSSGNSPNIINAFKKIQERKTLVSHSIALVGFDGGAVLKENLADVVIHVKSENYGVVEDCHSIVLHALIQKLRINTAVDASKIRL